MSIKISAVIITKNEVDRIGECIQSLHPLTDDIIVIDSGSTDGTIKKVKELGVDVFETDWKGYGPTKNFGHIKAKNDWIISLDADESLSEELIDELKNLNLTSGCVYAINRQNYYLGKNIKYSGWNPDWVYRVFDKKEVKWNDNPVHEKLTLTNQTKVIKLKHKLIHHSYRSIHDHMAKVEKYAALRAQIWLDNGIRPSLLKRWLGPLFKGFKSYILKLGFLDGDEGWIIAKMNVHLIKRQLSYYDKLKKPES